MLKYPQLKKCGESRIRTYEDVSQQSYSLPQLATLVSPRYKELLLFVCGYKYTSFCVPCNSFVFFCGYFILICAGCSIRQ